MWIMCHIGAIAEDINCSVSLLFFLSFLQINVTLSSRRDVGEQEGD